MYGELLVFLVKCSENYNYENNKLMNLFDELSLKENNRETIFKHQLRREKNACSCSFFFLCVYGCFTWMREQQTESTDLIGCVEIPRQNI